MDLSNPLLDFIEDYKLLILASFVLTILTVALASLFSVKYDPREPPIISHPIPFVGHIIGMFTHGAKYFDFIKYVIRLL